MASKEEGEKLNINDILEKHDVFLTGASGFVGMYILYKLLQITHQESFEIPNDKEQTQTQTQTQDIGHKIYLLLRKSKKYDSVYQRLEEEILRNELFEGYSEQQKQYLLANQKLVAMEGDLTHDNLGLSEKHLNQLKFVNNEGNGLYFIHCAADVQFDRPINTAMKLNVNGTYECLNVAKYCNAKSFVHISTLYVNCREHTEARLMERVYDQGFDGNEIFNDWRFKYKKELPKNYICNKIRSQRRKENENVDLSLWQKKEWPNTYTLTKNIAEQVIIKECKNINMPLAIARLGIVSPVAKGKKEGWFLGNGGFVFVAIGAASGHMKYFKKSSGDGRMDIVPCDYTVDAVMAVSAKLLHNVSKNSTNNANNTDTMTPNIYNIGIAANQPADWCVAKLFEYVVPRFKASDVPGTHPEGDVIFVSSDWLFWLIEMCIFDIPLFLIQPLTYYTVLKQFLSISVWINIFFTVFRYFGLRLFRSNEESCAQTQTMDETIVKKKRTKKMEIENEIKDIETIFSQKKSKLEKKIEFMTKARKKMKWFNENYDYFMSKRWKFDHTNVKGLYETLDEESRGLYDFDVNKIDINHYALTNSMFVMRQWFEKQQIRRKQRKAKFGEMKHRLVQLKTELKQMKQQKDNRVKSTVSSSDDDGYEVIKPSKASKHAPLQPISVTLRDKNGKNILNESCSSMRSLLNTADKATIEAISREAGHKVMTEFDDSTVNLKQSMVRNHPPSSRKQILQIMSRMGLTVGGIGFSHFGLSLIVTLGVAYIIFRDN